MSGRAHPSLCTTGNDEALHLYTAAHRITLTHTHAHVDTYTHIHMGTISEFHCRNSSRSTVPFPLPHHSKTCSYRKTNSLSPRNPAHFACAANPPTVLNAHTVRPHTTTTVGSVAPLLSTQILAEGYLSTPSRTQPHTHTHTRHYVVECYRVAAAAAARNTPTKKTFPM